MPIAITAEIDRIGNAVGARIDGDLGYDFLKHYRLGIDYQKEIVRLVQGNYEPAGAGAFVRSEVPFRLAAPHKPLVVVTAIVNGRGPYAFALDTGASMTSLSPALADQLQIPSEGATTMTGGGGTLQATTGRIASLAIGGAVLQDLGVVVSDFLGTISAAAGMKLDGVVGYNFLRRFRVTIDYPNARLCLVKAAG
jgi:predicted aspartyl protease